MKDQISALFASLVLVAALPARASTLGIPDGDSAVLAGLLFQAMKDSLQVGQILTTTQQALETAQFTMGAARAAVDVVGEFAYLTQNPDEIFDASASAFAATFPEVKAIADDAEGIRASFSRGMLKPGEVNPFALQEFFANVAGASTSGYQTLAGIDESVYGLTKEHLVTVELMKNVGVASEAIRKESMLALTPQGAAVIGAKAAAQTAVSAAVSATSLAELVRMQRLTYMKGLDSSSKAAADVATQFEAMKASLVADPVLDPLDPRLRGELPSTEGR